MINLGQICPQCGVKLNQGVMVVGNRDSARPGDFAVCSECGGLMRFNDDGNIAIPTEEEMIHARNSNPLAWAVMLHTQDLIKESRQAKVSLEIPNNCPHCGVDLLAMTKVAGHGDRMPGPGDFTLCPGCGEIAQFDDNMKSVMPSIDAMIEMQNKQPRVWAIINAAQAQIKEAIRMGGTGI